MCFCCRPFPDCDIALRLERSSEEEMEITIIKPRKARADAEVFHISADLNMVNIDVVPERSAEHITLKFEQSDGD